jgi:signal transduction histidine kinase
VRSEIYGAARELLMNVVKHPGAGRAVIALRHGGNDVVISVADDDRGCDTEQLNSRAGGTGFGLFNIREHRRSDEIRGLTSPDP